MTSLLDPDLYNEPVLTDPAFVPPENITIRGKYVTLTAFTEEHIPSLWKHLDPPNNPALWDHVRNSTPSSPAELWDGFCAGRKQRGFVLYAVLADPERLSPNAKSLNGSNGSSHTETLGAVAYHDIAPEHRSLEVGSVLFSPALQRTAAATEIHFLLLQLAFEGAGISGDSPPSQPPAPLSPTYRRVVWKCNRRNLKSRHAAERLGFVYEGTFRKHLILKGRNRDSDYLSLIDDEWPTIKAAFEKWLDESNFDESGKQKQKIEELRETAPIR